MGHEKVARLPFCTCPCDILSGVIMYIAWSVLTVSQQSRCYHFSPPPLVVLVRMLLALIHQSMLRTRATFSWPTLYIIIYRDVPTNSSFPAVFMPGPRRLVS